MHYHLILTEHCNSNCRYCYEKSMKEFDNGLEKKFDFDFSQDKKITTEELKKFLEKDKDAILIFYGGEPLLEIGKIKEIIDKIKIPIRMQTNGLLLNKLPISYLKKIDKILISLDGDKERTDNNRGKETFGKVTKNIEKIKEEGYDGELIARMCLSFPDIFTQVKNLLSIGFTSIHWQIDAGFYKFDFDEKKFEKFTEEYNKEIEKLINFWIENLKQGKVLKFYPFLGIIDSLLKNEKTLLRCGAGHSGYAITLDGKIVACPIMNCIKNFEAGNLNDEPKNLKKFSVEEECQKCGYLDLCGGRCLYANKAQLWPKKGRELICKTVKFYIDKLKEKMPEIKSLIANNIIKKEDFEYEKYFGPEIIP